MSDEGRDMGVKDPEEEAAKETHAERIQKLFDRWKEGFALSDEEKDKGRTTPEIKCQEFFQTIPSKEIIQMCKLDPENVLTVMDKLQIDIGGGVDRALPSIKHVMKAYSDNHNTICEEVCRAVRRGRVK